jgi:hypothetical protein
VDVRLTGKRAVITGAAIYLASDEASFTTGATSSWTGYTLL